MEDKDYRTCLTLLPPSPFMRNGNSVALVFGAYTFLMAVVFWAGTEQRLSAGETAQDVFWRGTLADIIAANAAVTAAWFCFVLLASVSRLRRYRRAEKGGVSRQIYLLTLPWAVAFATGAILCAVESNARGKGQALLYVVLPGVVGVVFWYVAPFLEVLTTWLPVLRPEAFKNLGPAMWSVMLGPKAVDEAHLDEYIREVAGFARRFAAHTNARASGQPSSGLRHLYYREDTLDVFQKTLSCIYETGEYVGHMVKEAFAGKQWSMLDIGGGEGYFTSEVLRQIPPTALPATLTLAEVSSKNSELYRERLTRLYARIDVKNEVGCVEDVLDFLPQADFILASHSLYSIMDLSRKGAGEVIGGLLGKISDGFCLAILASKNSQAYELKREVLEELDLPDHSSFGEDFVTLIPSGYAWATESRDSFIDVTGLLNSDDLLLAWLGYFCRVDVQELTPHVTFWRRLMRRSSLRVGALPLAFRERLQGGAARVGLNLLDDSRILFHKECLIKVQPAGRLGEPVSTGACSVASAASFSSV